MFTVHIKYNVDGVRSNFSASPRLLSLRVGCCAAVPVAVPLVCGNCKLVRAIRVKHEVVAGPTPTVHPQIDVRSKYPISYLLSSLGVLVHASCLDPYLHLDKAEV